MKKNSKSKIARVYATALYEAAEDKGCVDKVWKDIGKLEVLLEKEPELKAYLASPLWSEKDKKDVLKKTAEALALDEDTKNCLQLVVQNNRVSYLPDILDGFARVYYMKNNIAEVEVETVRDLSAAQDKCLRGILQKLFAKNIVVKYNINPAILGGLRVKCGSKMYDDCLATKLNYLENVMKGK